MKSKKDGERLHIFNTTIHQVQGSREPLTELLLKW